MIKTDLMREIHHNAMVWVNKTTENLRKEECLCLRCSKMSKCQAAKEFYELCCKNDCALIMTRCKEFELKRAE
jgi:hypothetical protein